MMQLETQIDKNKKLHFCKWLEIKGRGSRLELRLPLAGFASIFLYF